MQINSRNGPLLFYDTHFVTTALLRPSICILLQGGNSHHSSEATGVLRRRRWECIVLSNSHVINVVQSSVSWCHPQCIPDLSVLVTVAAPFDPRQKVHYFPVMRRALLGGLGGPWSTHNFGMKALIYFKFSELIPWVLYFLDCLGMC